MIEAPLAVEPGTLAFGQFVVLGLFPAALCGVIATDVSRRVIPNPVVLLLVAGFVALAALVPVPALGVRLFAAAAATCVGFALFASDVVGAGDAKLAGALALWVDPALWPAFILICGLIGGLMTLAATLGVRLCAGRAPGPLARASASLPYGVALAGAGLMVHPFSSLAGLSGLL